MATKGRILVADDEPANRKLLADLIAREGYEAVTAEGGREALDILSRQPIDLVLLDIMMPEVNGIMVLAELQKQGALPALPVIVVTAHEERKIRIDALTSGATDFLLKPIDRIEVACKIRTQLELSRLRKQAAADATHLLANQVKSALEQLPIALYRMQYPEVTATSETRWVIGDIAGLTGLSEDAFIAGTNWIEAVHPEDRSMLQRELERGFSGTTRNMSCRFRLVHASGTRWLMTKATFDAASQSMTGALLDITDQHLLELGLVQARKLDALGQLAGGVAHDFNNLLGVIISCASLVRDGLEQGNAQKEDVLDVLKAANQAVGLTKQLLTFSREQPSTKRPVDLNHNLAELGRMLSRTVGEHIKLTVTPSARPAVVNIDPVALDQVLLNLVLNARDAMPDGGKIHVALTHFSQDTNGSPSQDVIRLTVSDTGIGMDDATQQRMFDPFFTTKEVGRGTGLGLATCFGIVAEVGGTIRADSAPGKGTIFTIDLPLCKQAIGSTVEEHRIERVGHGETVLVVEDELALQRVTKRVLENAGFVVLVASNGQEATKKLDEMGARVDLIFCDVAMPGCTGYDVAEYATRVAPTVAILLTCGYLDERIRARVRREFPILWKPVSPRKLVSAVAQALTARRLVDGQTQPEVSAALATELVVVVTADPDVRSAVTSALATAGYLMEVADTVTGAEALLRHRTHPSMIICDVSLSDAPGATLVERISVARPDLISRICVVTEAAASKVDETSNIHGTMRILPKPIEPERLLGMLAELRLAHARQAAITQSWRPSALSRSASPGVQGGNRARKERVLFIEDDNAFASAGGHILRGAGFEVVFANTLRAAREKFSTCNADVVVADIGLPDGSALDLIQELRDDHIEIPIVVLTGSPSVESAASAIRWRISEYLTKPLAPEQLIRAVSDALESGRIARLRCQLLSARSGGDEFLRDIGGTEKLFASALPKLRMVYQPIVRAGDSSIYGYEALLRCDEPALASPLRFFAAAEVLGRVKEVGRAVRAAVAATILDRKDCIEAIFVNVHPSEFQVDVLAEVADPLLMVARRVVLEVTERASLEAGPRLEETVGRIRNLGYRLAVDDLGEGYAGLSSLVHLQPDIAKIDMSLVRNIDREPLKRNIVGALVDLARRSGITVVAEGIETVEERTALVDLGCDLLQGYLFSKPAPPFPVSRSNFEPHDAQDAPQAQSAATSSAGHP